MRDIGVQPGIAQKIAIHKHQLWLWVPVWEVQACPVQHAASLLDSLGAVQISANPGAITLPTASVVSLEVLQTFRVSVGAEGLTSNCRAERYLASLAIAILGLLNHPRQTVRTP